MPDHDHRDDRDRVIRDRAFWSGTLSFGLVSIPVNLFPATRSAGVSLRMLAPDGTPLARRYFDPETDREVPGDDLVRGFEIAPDRFVLLSDQELEGLAPEKSRDIDLRRFVDREAIPPIFFDRPYFLAPDGPSNKAYRLLAATMEELGKAGIATFVMRSKEYLVAILAENGILRAETLRFPEQIRDPDDLDLPEPDLADDASIEAFEKAIRRLNRKTLDRDELHDDHARRVRDLVEAKRKAGRDVVAAPDADRHEDGRDQDGDVIDLMEVLKRSLARDEPAGDLDLLTRAQLYEHAQRLDIPGRSGMTKTELIRAILRHDAALARHAGPRAS